MLCFVCSLPPKRKYNCSKGLGVVRQNCSAPTVEIDLIGLKYSKESKQVFTLSLLLIIYIYTSISFFLNIWLFCRCCLFLFYLFISEMDLRLNFWYHLLLFFSVLSTHPVSPLLLLVELSKNKIHECEIKILFFFFFYKN